MARYTDINALIEKVEETDWYHISEQGELVIGANSKYNIPLYKHSDIVCVLNNAPTADVVPKSEVDKWMRRCQEWPSVAELKSQQIEKLEQDVTRVLQENEALKDGNEHLAVLLSEAKAEVARVIFTDVDNTLRKMISVVNDAIHEAIVEQNDVALTSHKGSLSMLDTARMCIANLKKKYTEQCPDCKHFVGCDPYKTMFYKTSGESCEEFEEEKT